MKDKRGRTLDIGTRLTHERRSDWTTQVVGFRSSTAGRVAVLRESDFDGRLPGCGPTFTETELHGTAWVVS